MAGPSSCEFSSSRSGSASCPSSSTDFFPFFWALALGTRLARGAASDSSATAAVVGLFSDGLTRFALGGWLGQGYCLCQFLVRDSYRLGRMSLFPNLGLAYRLGRMSLFPNLGLAYRLGRMSLFPNLGFAYRMLLICHHSPLSWAIEPSSGVTADDPDRSLLAASFTP